MRSRAPGTGSAGYANVAAKHTCPLCAGYLIRIPRRAIDRLLSQFVLVHRYRCADYLCRWEGNLRVRSRAAATIATSPR